jgi:polysaccharide chain length determinant protein (PEP-CTERM system associated)
MESLRTLLRHYVKSAWRRRWAGVAVAWLICGVGWAAVYSMPNQYESSARMFVDADAVLTPLLRGLAADNSALTQLDILQRTLLSGPNIEKLINKTDLDLSVNGPGDRESLVKALSTQIRVTPQTRNLFTISYRNPSPKMAYDVVQTLLTIFIESATGGNRTDMENARRFLEHQISSYEQQLRAAERRRADFRAKYADMLPNDNGGSTSTLDTARSTARGLAGQLQDATMKRDALKAELATTPPLVVVEHSGSYVGPGGVRAPLSRLDQAVQDLAELRLKYTEAYPDVIATRKRVEELKAGKLGNSGGARAPGGGAASADGGRSLPNPVYEQIKIRFIDAEGLVHSLERQTSEANVYRDRLEKIQRDQPGLVAEFANLDRDYNVLRKNYEELLSRLQSANIAQAADTQADKVKLQIVDPPQVSRVPVAPNRPLLLALVLLAGLGAGVALPVFMGQLDQSFATLEELRSIGVPVLGAISMFGTPPRREKIMSAVRFSVAVLLLFAVFAGILAKIFQTSVDI